MQLWDHQVKFEISIIFVEFFFFKKKNILNYKGCGKSSMLDILADRKTDGEISGTILVNGEKR